MNTTALSQRSSFLRRLATGYAALAMTGLRFLGWIALLAAISAAIAAPLWALARFLPGVFTILVVGAVLATLSWVLFRRRVGPRGLAMGLLVMILAGALLWGSMVIALGAFLLATGILALRHR